MRKLYILVCLLSFGTAVFAQEVKDTVDTTQKQDAKTEEIAGFEVYPNPVTNGVVMISSTTNDQKDIYIFDILGKVVLSRKMVDSQIDVSILKSGVYILKVIENNKTATRKLVIR